MIVPKSIRGSTYIYINIVIIGWIEDLLLRRCLFLVDNKNKRRRSSQYYRHASRKAVFYKKTGVPRGAFYIFFSFTQDSFFEQV